MRSSAHAAQSHRGKDASSSSVASESETATVTFKVIRTISLLVLTIQNCSLMLVASYSRSKEGPRYLTSSAVVAAEVVKTLVVLAVLLRENGLCNAIKILQMDVCSRNSQTLRFALPALFYTVQNNLWYTAMSNLDSVTAAVTSQFKVPSTAVFSVLILNKKLNRVHWLALIVLVMGLIIMQTETNEVEAHQRRSGAPDSSYYFGLFAMLAACTSSGYAGVYLELLFKQLNSNIWIANMQLQLFCVPIATLSLLADWGKIVEKGPFVGWDVLTCIVVLLNALGGFCVSLTMKYADNILKTFAVSMSLVVNCLLSTAFLDLNLTVQDVIGVLLVMGATFLYTKAGTCITSSSHGHESYLLVERQGSSLSSSVGKPLDLELAISQEDGEARPAQIVPQSPASGRMPEISAELPHVRVRAESSPVLEHAHPRPEISPPFAPTH